MNTDSTRVGGGRFIASMFILVLVEALSSFETVMIIAALPLIARDFGLASAGWAITGFLLVQAGSAAIAARLGDIYGRVRALMWVLALTIVGSLISAMGLGVAAVIAGRCLQGLSGANLALCYGIASRTAPPATLPFWIGALTGGVTLAAAFGYVLGGYLADLGNWRLIFWFAAAYGALVLPLVFLFVPRDPGTGQKGRIDWLGGLLLPPGVACLLYGISTLVTAGVGNPVPFIIVAAGVSLLIWWWIHEYNRTDPLIQVRLLMRRPILVANLCFAIAALGIMQFPLVLIQFLQQPTASGTGLGLSATLAGLIKLPSNAGSVIAAMVAGWLCGRFGGKWVIQFGGLLAGLSLGSFLIFDANQWQIMAITIGAAAGMTTLLAAVPNVILANTEADRAGEATGLAMTVLRIFTAAGAQVVTFTLAASALPMAGASRAYPAKWGYDLIMAGTGISGVLIALVAAIGLRTQGKVRDGRAPSLGNLPKKERHL